MGMFQPGDMINTWNQVTKLWLRTAQTCNMWWYTPWFAWEPSNQNGGRKLISMVHKARGWCCSVKLKKPFYCILSDYVWCLSHELQIQILVFAHVALLIPRSTYKFLSWYSIKRKHLCYRCTGRCGGTTGWVNLSRISWGCKSKGWYWRTQNCWSCSGG